VLTLASCTLRKVIVSNVVHAVRAFPCRCQRCALGILQDRKHLTSGIFFIHYSPGYRMVWIKVHKFSWVGTSLLLSPWMDGRTVEQTAPYWTFSTLILLARHLRLLVNAFVATEFIGCICCFAKLPKRTWQLGLTSHLFRTMPSSNLAVRSCA